MAHPTRSWALAEKLDKNEFEIHFATPKNYHVYLNNFSNNFSLYDLPTITNETFNVRLFLAKFPYQMSELKQNLQYDNQLIQKVKPDFIVSDFRPSAPVASKVNHIPLINLIQYHWHPNFKRKPLIPNIRFRQIFGRKLLKILTPFAESLVLKNQLEIINEFLSVNHVDTVDNLFEFYCLGDYLIFPDCQTIFPDAKLKINETFIGPLIWNNTITPWPKLWPSSKSKRLSAYISLGSTGNHALVPDIVDSLKQANFEIFLSTSGIKTNANLIAGVHSADFIPINKLLPMIDIMICNGGTSTTYHSLSMKTPVFSFPNNLDQYLHVTQLQRFGLTDFEEFDSFSRTRFLNKIEHLINSQNCLVSRETIFQEIASLETNNIIQVSFNKMINF
ncbi:MAG: hypothetical protein KDD45_06620 [Bdellovibrionales bacterium]|nr:hypothetical protein [Bdellovibrionales bacterium]